MLKYILRRLLQAIPTLFGISIISYGLMTLAPGGPTAALLADPKLSPQQRQMLAEQLGSKDPLAVQYVRWLIGDDWFHPGVNSKGRPNQPGTNRGILRGDFGYSFFSRRPVVDLIGERIPATLELGVSALVIELLLGVPIGIVAAVRRGTWFDSLTRVLAVVFNAIPIFWLGLILILLFGSWLHLLPMGGRCPDALFGCPPLTGRINFLILPAIVLATGGVAGYSRYMRASMLDVINQDYIRTAQSKGLRARAVWFQHGARNAMIPLATFLGPALTGLLSGAVLTETIFSWPGLGQLAFGAVVNQDFPVIMAVVLLTSVATILGYILSDIFYVFIDPRIRFS